MMNPAAILVLPRLFLGMIFLVAANGKLHAGANLPVVVQGFLTHMLPNAGSAYQAFANAFVLPNISTIAALDLAGELFVGIAMVLGFATRLAALVAILLLLNYMLVKGMAFWMPASNDAADIVMAIVVGVGAAGRVWGIDAFLARRYPRIPLW